MPLSQIRKNRILSLACFLRTKPLILIGASDEEQEGSWQWITGENWSYTNWIAGEPNGGTRENYVILTNPDANIWGWNDATNSHEGIAESMLSFICEWGSTEADFAPMNPEYLRYLEDPEAYFEGSEFYGDIPAPLDLSHLANNPPKGTQAVSSTFTVSALPAKYDPRTSGTLPPIRDQGSYGTCWSFASLGALETNYLAQKLGSTAPDTAELHQAWYVFKNNRPGYSFSIPFLSCAGTASENELPYSTADNITSNPPSKLPEEYSNPIRLKEAYHIGAVNSSNRDEIKSLIRQRGAVAVSYSHEHDELSGSSYYYDTTIGGGHMVSVVGWDDDYPASNFKNRPSSNGAWLIRNSWGTNWGDSGYFWMSYEQAIAQCTAYIAAANSGLKHKGYDVLTQAGSINYHWSANVFKAEGRETIKEVAFTTTDNNVPYDIYINHLGKTLPVNPGTPKNKAASGIMPYAGYHSITLSSPVELEDGEYFAVILKAGQASTYQYSTAVEDVVTVRTASVNTGESYFAKNENVPASSDWKDGATILYNKTGRPCNACVKAFTVDASVEPDPVTPDPITPEPAPVITESGGSGGGGCSTSTASFILAAVLAVKLRKH